MSKQSKTNKKETEGALVARRTKEVELAKVLSTPEAKKRLQENRERAKAKAAAKKAEPKAAAPRQRAGEWFFGQDGQKAFGPFATQIEALEDARKRWPKHSARLTRKLSRFVRIGVWLNTAKLQSGERLKWYATTRDGNEGLFNLPKPASAHIN